jgi:hypothetical protein
MGYGTNCLKSLSKSEATNQRSNLVAFPQPYQHHHIGEVFGETVAKPAVRLVFYFVKGGDV